MSPEILAKIVKVSYADKYRKNPQRLLAEAINGIVQHLPGGCNAIPQIAVGGNCFAALFIVGMVNQRDEG